ncbi:MAG: metalloregulator ArsR/SmtB family transcription factor [Chloroflexota bacterium]|nr:metalloregulator ArsR/SmtB family transcription factor [Chloroflexota bacterium]
MGKLLVGRPTLTMDFVVSAPLDFVATLVLVYRAPEMGTQADAWCTATHAALDDTCAHMLDTLYGSSGRGIYFAEELLMSFDPLAPDRRTATYATYRAALAHQSPAWFQNALMRALRRVHHEQGTTIPDPADGDRTAWERFLAPGITRANLADIVALAMRPNDLKAETLALYDIYEERFHAADFAASREPLHGAAERAERLHESYLDEAFADMTGNRLPPEIEHAAREVERATFVPCVHLGPFLSYVLYPPELVVYFDATRPLGRPARNGRIVEESAASDDLAALRALADGTRLKIIAILRDGELYAQEVVARLGISQSAVSRHLSMLESAEIVRVRPTNGMKYYAVNAGRLKQLAESLSHLAE